MRKIIRPKREGATLLPTPSQYPEDEVSPSSSGPSSIPHCLRRCRQSCLVVGPVFLFRFQCRCFHSTHRRLRRPRCSLRRIVSSDSSIDSSVVVVLIGDVSVDLDVMTTMIRPHSTTPPRKTVQEFVLVIENIN